MDVKSFKAKDIIDALIEHYRSDEEIGAHDLDNIIADCEIEGHGYVISDAWEPVLFSLGAAKCEKQSRGDE